MNPDHSDLQDARYHSRDSTRHHDWDQKIHHSHDDEDNQDQILI